MAKDWLVSWLDDAHALENALIPVLEKHAEQAADHPEIRQRIEQHVSETRRHADLVRTELERLGATPSGLKRALGSLAGGLERFATAPFEDTLIKNALMDYAAEQFEIASYRALRTAAEAAGRPDTVRLCEVILREEEGMARYLEQALPSLVRETVREGPR